MKTMWIFGLGLLFLFGCTEFSKEKIKTYEDGLAEGYSQAVWAGIRVEQGCAPLMDNSYSRGYSEGFRRMCSKSGGEFEALSPDGLSLPLEKLECLSFYTDKPIRRYDAG